MKTFSTILIWLGLVFPMHWLWAHSDTIIQQSISASKVKTGEVIHLKWRIQGDLKTKISWATTDFLFRQSDKLTVLRMTSQTTPNLVYIHQIDFTVTTPQRIAVKGLPVIVDGKTRMTPAFNLEVKSSALPIRLHAIMPIVSVEWHRLMVLWFYLLGMLFVIGIAIIFSYRRFQNWYQKSKDSKQQQYILYELNALEHATNFENIATADLVKKVTDLMWKFQKANPNIQSIATIEEHGKKLLFLPDAIAKGYYPDFFNEVKRCIDASKSIS